MRIHKHHTTPASSAQHRPLPGRPSATSLQARLTLLLLTLLLTPMLQAGISPLAFGSRGGLPTLAPILEQVIPAVVSISATLEQRSPEQRPATTAPSPLQHDHSGHGSGVVIDHHHGIIITNHHLIEGAKQIEVTLEDGRRFDAINVGSDKATDITLLKINASNLKSIPLGNSDTLRVGDFVIAVGNPFGLGNTATSGIVSALGRSNLGLERYEEFIQTDASINVGNSGGALVNLNGELVGINTAILAPNGGSVGIGFAIPVNMVREISNQLLHHGKVERGQLGIRAKPLSDNLARSLRLSSETGVVVDQVTPGSSAAHARIRKGDIITTISDHRISSPAQLESVIGLFPIGKEVKISLIRGNLRHNLFATIQPRTTPSLAGGRLNRNLSGTRLTPLSTEQKGLYRSEGVAVQSVDPAQAGWALGLRPGDVIFSLNRQPTRSLRELEEAAALSDDMVILRLYRGEKILEMIMR
jgi:Do/DeqQ family serine protease